MHPNVHCNTTYHSQDMEATEMSNQMAREDVVYIHNGVLLSHKNETMLFVATWVVLGIIILNEIR